MGRSGLEPRLAVLRLFLSRLSPKRSHPTHVLDLHWKTRSSPMLATRRVYQVSCRNIAITLIDLVRPAPKSSMSEMACSGQLRRMSTSYCGLRVEWRSRIMGDRRESRGTLGRCGEGEAEGPEG